MEEPSPETIVEARKEHMVSVPNNGDQNPTLRTAHFLKPSITTSIADNIPNHPSQYSPSSLPSTFDPQIWPLNVTFHGWRYPQRKWKAWVHEMAACHEPTWKRAGIYQAILSSTYQIPKSKDLVLGLGEKWCPQNNTFIFPWGEATITLEDMMVAGYSVLGSPVFSPLETEDLKEVEEKLIELRRELSRTKAKKACQHAWINYFMENKSEIEHEAFLSLWLARFVFPNNSSETISKYVFAIAVRLGRGIKVAIAPALLANLYRELSLLKGKMVALSEACEENGDGMEKRKQLSICSPFQIVQVWAWERFVNLRPRSNVIDFKLSKFARWHNVKVSRIGNVRLALESTGASFLWRPHATAAYNSCYKFYDDEGKWVYVDMGLEEDLESFARCLRPCQLVGIGCIEQYSPHRVTMQFGMDQDLPGPVTRCNGTPKICWNSYNKPIIDSGLYIPSRHFKPGVTLRYSKWWTKSMLGGQDAGRSAKSSKSFQATFEGEDNVDHHAFTTPGLGRKYQHLEAWDSDDGEDNLTSRNSSRRAGNEMDGGLKSLSGAQSLSSSAAESGFVVKKEALMRSEEKNMQSESLSRGKRTMEDANESKVDGLDNVHSIDHHPFSPPGFAQKHQVFEEVDSAEEDNLSVKELLTSRNKSRRVVNEIDGNLKSLSCAQSLKSLAAGTGIVVKKRPLMKPEEKNMQRKSSIREKRGMEDANENKLDRLDHNVDGKDPYAFSPPGFGPKYQLFEAVYCAKEDNLSVKEIILTSRNKGQRVRTEINGDPKSNSWDLQILSTSAAESRVVVKKESLMEEDEKNMQTEFLSRKKTLIEDGNENKVDGTNYTAYATEDNEGETGSKYTIQKRRFLELEARIRKLERDFDKVKDGRFEKRIAAEKDQCN